MIGKIDHNGQLWIQRGKELKGQSCPHGGQCDDHCSLFGEPDTHQIDCVRLTLCHRMLIFEKLEDER